MEKEGNKRYDTAYIMIQKRFLLRLCAESIIWTVKNVNYAPIYESYIDKFKI